MEWCLNCHRNPELYVRPKEQVFRHDVGNPPAISWTRPRLVREYGIRVINELFHVPPMIDPSFSRSLE